MGLTRPTAAQIDSSTEVITDPISLLNNKSNRANVDVGFLFNRDGGISSNVAVFWQESNQRFVFALTSSNAVGRFSNIAVTSNANVVAGNVFAAGYFYANGAVFSGGGGGSNYSNVDVKAYTETMGFQNYSNVNVAAYTQTQSYSNYSNVNLSAYLGGAVTIGGNLTVQGNLFVNGNLTTINANNLNIADSMIYLADNNPADTLDIGFVSAFTSAVRYQHTGFVRDATDGVWKLFANVVAEPTTTIDFTGANYANLLVGNITTAGTITVNPGTGGNTIISKGNLYIDGTPGILRISSGYTGGFQIDGNGPRLGLGTLANTFAFFDVYAINNNTYINSSSRPLYIGFSTGGAGGNVLYMDPRWGNTVLNTNVASISTTTGAFVVTGGVGIGGNLNVGGNVSASLINTTGNVLATGAILNYLDVNGNVDLGLAGQVSGSWVNVVGNITQTSSGGAVYINTTGNVIAASVIAGTSTIGGLTLTSGALYRNGGETQIIGGGGQTTRTMIRLGNSQGMVLYGSGTAAAPSVPNDGIVIHGGDGNVRILAPNTASGGSRIQIQAQLVEIQGNLTPVGNLVYNIGNVTNSWNTVYAGNISATGTVGASLINSTGNVLATGLSIFGNVALGSLTTPGALNTLAGNVSILGVSSMLNIIGNIVVNNTAIASSNVTGAIRTTGGIGVGGNLYVGQRVGYVWGANNVSSVYQVFNNSTNSLDTVFG